MKARVSSYAAQFLEFFGWKACEMIGLVSGVVVPEVDFLGHRFVQFEGGEPLFAVIANGHKIRGGQVLWKVWVNNGFSFWGRF